MAMPPIKQHHTAIRLVLCQAYTEGSSFLAAELSVMAMQHYKVFSVTASNKGHLEVKKIHCKTRPHMECEVSPDPSGRHIHRCFIG